MAATQSDRLGQLREGLGQLRGRLERLGQLREVIERPGRLREVTERLGQLRERLGQLRETFDRWREWAQRSRSTLIGLGLILVLLLIANAGADDYAGLAELAEREAELEFRLEEAKLRVESLERAVVLLQDDPMVLERLAREELGLVRPGDTIVVLPRTDN